jgi:hypothetical protein
VTLGLLHFLDNRLTDGGRYLVLISLTGRVEPRDIMLLEGLRKFKKNYHIGNRIRDIRPSNILPEPTSLQRASTIGGIAAEYLDREEDV